MANGPFIGRRESFGLGKETTPGTAVSPTNWLPHLALTLDPKTNVAQNKSALGTEEDINDSLVTEQWTEGSLNAKVYDVTTGYLLLNIFGSVAAAAHSGETIVYDNTFTRGTAPALTLARVNPIESRRYAMAYQTDFELDVKQGDWAQTTSSLVAKASATASDTAAYVVENEFTSKHLTVKIASTTGGLGAASALDVKSIKLKITRKRDRYVPMGAIDPSSFDPNEFSVTGELVARFTDATLEALGSANTRQAMSIALVNGDVTIGSAAHPSLTFTMPKIRLSPMSLDNNLAQPLNQTYQFTAELDQSLGYMITAVAVNSKNGY